MDPLGVSQIISSPVSSPRKETARLLREPREEVPPATPAKEVNTPSSAGPSRAQQQQLHSPQVAQWPASPVSSGSGNFSAQQTAPSPWTQQAQSSPARNSPGQPRSPYTREPPLPQRVNPEISDDDTAPVSSGARYNAQQAQEQAQARARQGMQQSREAAAHLEAMREKDRVEGYVRIRVMGLERNKKDLWVKMEATVRLIL